MSKDNKFKKSELFGEDANYTLTDHVFRCNSCNKFMSYDDMTLSNTGCPHCKAPFFKIEKE